MQRMQLLVLRLVLCQSLGEPRWLWFALKQSFDLALNNRSKELHVRVSSM